MKTIAAVVVLGITAIWAVGAVVLSDKSATRFLDEMETLSLHGHLDEYCARLHADLTVSIQDRTGDPPAEFTGNARDFCEYVTHATKGVASLGLATSVVRNDFTLTRDWLHPWTVRVRYREDRTSTTRRFESTTHTRGEDDLVLVLTFSGIKLRRLESRSWLAEDPPT